MFGLIVFVLRKSRASRHGQHGQEVKLPSNITPKFSAERWSEFSVFNIFLYCFFSAIAGNKSAVKLFNFARSEIGMKNVHVQCGVSDLCIFSLRLDSREAVLC